LTSVTLLLHALGYINGPRKWCVKILQKIRDRRMYVFITSRSVVIRQEKKIEVEEQKKKL